MDVLFPVNEFVDCPECNGNGWIENKLTGYQDECIKCNGYGEIMSDEIDILVIRLKSY